MIPAAVAERGRRLQTKAQQGRPMASILKLQPSGKAALKDKPRRDAFEAGAAGDKQWAEATRDATEGFVLASRQASTDLEHVTYMLEWNKLLVQEGFGAYDCARGEAWREEHLHGRAADDRRGAGRGRQPEGGATDSNPARAPALMACPVAEG